MRKIFNPDSKDISLFGKTIPAKGFIIVDEDVASMLQSVCATISNTLAEEVQETAPPAEEKSAEPVKKKKSAKETDTK